MLQIHCELRRKVRNVDRAGYISVIRAPCCYNIRGDRSSVRAEQFAPRTSHLSAARPIPSQAQRASVREPHQIRKEV